MTKYPCFLLFVFATLVAPVLLHAEKYRDLEFEETEASIRITDYSDYAIGDLSIPAEINGKPVTVIGEDAFNRSDLDVVKIPDTVLVIEESAFWNSTAKRIEIPASVTAIDYNAFLFCRLLEWIEVDQNNSNYASVDGVLFTKAMDELLWMPAAKELQEAYVVPETVTHIADYSFRESALTEVTLPEGLVSIGESAFNGSSLTSLTIPSSTSMIGDYALFNCRFLTEFVVNGGNSSFSSADGVLFSQDMSELILYPQSKSGQSYSIPEGVTRIGDSAFQGSIYLQELTFPATLTEFGLSSLDFMWSSSFDVAGGNTEFKAIDGVLFSQDGTQLLAYPRRKDATSYAVPVGTQKIGPFAFLRCSSLMSITLPDGLIELGENAFEFCQLIESFELPESITHIGNRCFYYCSSLRTLNLPSGIDFLGSGLFERCGSLLSMEIPQGITEIKESTFYYCTNIESIVLPESIQTIGDRAFQNCRLLPELVIPTGVTSIGENAFNSLRKISTFSVPEGVEVIPFGAFGFCDDLVSIQLPSSLKRIEDEAFHLCRSLDEIRIPENVEFIGERVFNDCDLLTSIDVAEDNLHYESVSGILFTEDLSCLVRSPSFQGANPFALVNNIQRIMPYALQNTGFQEINLPESLLVIGSNAFEDCDYLESIEIPESVIELGEEVFLDCDKLRSAVLPAGISSIPFRLFGNCEILYDVLIPQSVTRIEDRVFNGCRELPTVQLPDGLNFIGNAAFTLCRQLYDIDITSSVQQIGDYAFSGCEHLYDLTLNEGLEIIGENAFEDCRFLESIELPQSLKVIETGAFRTCTKLTDLRFSDGLEKIAFEAFRDCRGLEQIVLPASLSYLGGEAFTLSGLQYVYFLGNAPELGKESPFNSIHFDAKVYYFEGVTGFTTPSWGGLPTVSLGQETDAVSWLIKNNLTHDTDLGQDPFQAGLPLIVNYSLNQVPGDGLNLMVHVENNTTYYSFFGGREEIAYIAEISKDLITWTTTGVSLSEPDSDGIRTASFDLEEGRCFVRFRFQRVD